MSLTLAILAAGVGSRFGADKQLQHINGSNTLFVMQFMTQLMRDLIKLF